MLFYEETGERLEFEGITNPPAGHYPTYTILYNPFTAVVWWRCHQKAASREYQWFEVDINEVDKRFRMFALLGG